MVAKFQEVARKPLPNMTGWCNSRKELEYFLEPGDEAARNILRDKKSSWKLNYYEGTQSIHDVAVASAQASINGLKRHIKEYDAQLEKITAQIEQSKK